MLLDGPATRDLIHNTKIPAGWIDRDYLSHLGYHSIFMDAERCFLERVEIDEAYRLDTGCAAYMVDEHIAYLRPVPADSSLGVTSQILDLTNKALHVIFLLQATGGVSHASRECLFVHGALEHGALRSRPFARYQLSNIVRNFERDKKLERPLYAGRNISIRRRVEC